MRVQNKTTKILLASTLICLTLTTDAGNLSIGNIDKDVTAVARPISNLVGYSVQHAEAMLADQSSREVRAAVINTVATAENAGCLPRNAVRRLTPARGDEYDLPILIGEITLNVLLTPIIAMPLLYCCKRIAEAYGGRRV